MRMREWDDRATRKHVPQRDGTCSVANGSTLISIVIAIDALEAPTVLISATHAGSADNYSPTLLSNGLTFPAASFEEG